MYLKTYREERALSDRVLLCREASTILRWKKSYNIEVLYKRTSQLCQDLIQVHDFFSQSHVLQCRQNLQVWHVIGAVLRFLWIITSSMFLTY